MQNQNFYFNLFSELIPGIVHEINNPLGALIMNVSILKDDIKQDNYKTLIDELEDTVNDMESALYKIKDYINAIGICMSPSGFSSESIANIEKLFDYAELLIHKKIKNVISVTKNFPSEQHFFTYVKPAVVIFSLLYAMNQILESHLSDRIELSLKMLDSNQIKLSFQVQTADIIPAKAFLDVLENENFSCNFSNN